MDKTRLIEFGRFAARDRKQRGEGKPATFTFLGFYPLLVGNATRAEPSPYGGSPRRSAWLRNSKPSRLSFSAGCIIAWPKSAHGSGRLCWVTTNTTLFPETRHSYASSNFACVGYGKGVLARRSQRAKMRWERFTPVLNRGFLHPAF